MRTENKKNTFQLQKLNTERFFSCVKKYLKIYWETLCRYTFSYWFAIKFIQPTASTRPLGTSIVLTCSVFSLSFIISCDDESACLVLYLYNGSLQCFQKHCSSINVWRYYLSTLYSTFLVLWNINKAWMQCRKRYMCLDTVLKSKQCSFIWGSFEVCRL